MQVFKLSSKHGRGKQTVSNANRRNDFIIAQRQRFKNSAKTLEVPTDKFTTRGAANFQGCGRKSKISRRQIRHLRTTAEENLCVIFEDFQEDAMKAEQKYP